MNIGKEWVFNSGFLLEASFGAGAGFYHVTESFTDAQDPSNNYQDRPVQRGLPWNGFVFVSPIHFPITSSLGIGYAF